MTGIPGISVKFSWRGATSMKSRSATNSGRPTEASFTKRAVRSGCDAKNAFFSLSGFSGAQLMSRPRNMQTTGSGRPGVRADPLSNPGVPFLALICPDTMVPWAPRVPYPSLASH
jgi:hypothetical protein